MGTEILLHFLIFLRETGQKKAKTQGYVETSDREAGTGADGLGSEAFLMTTTLHGWLKTSPLESQ